MVSTRSLASERMSKADQATMMLALQRELAKMKKAHEEAVEPSGVQALKNPNPLKDVEGLAVLAVAELS